MQHAILFGEYELTIDEKHRLLVPSDIRRSLDPQRDGESFFLVIGHFRKLWLYPERYYEALVSQMQAEMTPDEDLLAFDQMNFALASRITPDKQGRILIPEKLLKRSGTESEVTMIGSRDHLEIWNRADWEARLGELMEKRNEIQLRARQARRTSESQ